MAIIYTLLGVPYVAVIDPVRGVVLQKAARKRIPSPGQMSLFGSNEPKEGDTKVENGVTYRLNQNSRWERTDRAKGKDKTKAKAVVPVVKEEREEPTPEDLPQPTIGDMLAEQKAEEESGGMEVQGIAVEQGSNGLTTNPETFKDDWARLKELESDGIAKRVGTGLTYKIPGYTFVNKEIYKTDPNTYRQTAVNWFAVMPDKSSAQETRKASAKTQESLPKETRGGDGRKMISTAGAASALAEAVNGRLWQKKEGEIRIYVSGTNNGYLRISPETDSTSQVQYFMKSYDIPKVEEAVNAFNREYQITDMEDRRPKKKVLMQENEDGVIAPAGQHEPDTYITREWYE